MTNNYVVIQDPIEDGVLLDRRVCGNFLLSALCKEDKEQINRIEKYLEETLLLLKALKL